MVIRNARVTIRLEKVANLNTANRSLKTYVNSFHSHNTANACGHIHCEDTVSTYSRSQVYLLKQKHYNVVLLTVYSLIFSPDS